MLILHRIGAGTGIFTRALLASPDWSSSVKAIKAVEPSEGMRNTFSQTIQDSRVTVADGTFNQTGVEDGWANIIIIAQVSHVGAASGPDSAHTTGVPLVS